MSPKCLDTGDWPPRALMRGGSLRPHVTPFNQGGGSSVTDIQTSGWRWWWWEIYEEEEERMSLFKTKKYLPLRDLRDLSDLVRQAPVVSYTSFFWGRTELKKSLHLILVGMKLWRRKWWASKIHRSNDPICDASCICSTIDGYWDWRDARATSLTLEWMMLGSFTLLPALINIDTRDGAIWEWVAFIVLILY
jgi:hypothetical protein